MGEWLIIFREKRKKERKKLPGNVFGGNTIFNVEAEFDERIRDLLVELFEDLGDGSTDAGAH